MNIPNILCGSSLMVSLESPWLNLKKKKSEHYGMIFVASPTPSTSNKQNKDCNGILNIKFTYSGMDSFSHMFYACI